MKRQIVYPHMHMSVERLNKFLDGAHEQDYLIASSLYGSMPLPTDKQKLMVLTDADPEGTGLNYSICDELKVIDAHTHDWTLDNTLDIYIKPGSAFTSDTLFTVGVKAASGSEEVGADVKFTYPTTEVPSGSGASQESRAYVARIDALCIKYNTQDSLPETLTFLDINNNLYQEIRNAQRNDSYEIVIITGAVSPDPVTVVPQPPAYIPDGYYILAYIALRYDTVQIHNSNVHQEATGYLIDARNIHTFYNKQVTNERVTEDDLTGQGATNLFQTSYNFLRSSIEVYLNGIKLFRNSGTVTFAVVDNSKIILSSPKGLTDSLVVSYVKKLY